MSYIYIYIYTYIQCVGFHYVCKYIYIYIHIFVYIHVYNTELCEIIWCFICCFVCCLKCFDLDSWMIVGSQTDWRDVVAHGASWRLSGASGTESCLKSLDFFGKITGNSHDLQKIWLVSGESIFPSTNPLIDISIHPYSFFSPTNQITGKSYISW